MKKIKININSEIDLCSAHSSGVFFIKAKRWTEKDKDLYLSSNTVNGMFR